MTANRTPYTAEPCRRVEREATGSTPAAKIPEEKSSADVSIGSAPVRRVGEGRTEPARKETTAMRFMLMTKGGEQSTGNPPDENMMIEMGKFIEEMTKAGVLLATGGLDPEGIHIKRSGGKITVTDGPFAEAKEAVVGFALIDVRSKEEAIELSKRFWNIVGDGEGEIRQVFGP
jgi:hypothetical protein